MGNKFAYFLASAPLKQLPINEYKHLKRSRFFRWAILARWKYATKLLAVWIACFMMSMFIIAAVSVDRDITSSSFLKSAIVGKIAVLLALTKLYVAWKYVHLRLIDQKINYRIDDSGEISSWCKPELMLTRDLLLDRFQVRPILQTIKQTIFFLLLLLNLNFLILFFS